MAHRDLMRENAWMFDHEPAAEEIEELLKQVPAWHGSEVTMDKYQGFVISISQKVGPRDNKRTVWRLYTTVAGKIAILHDAHRNIDEVPIPVTEDVEREFKGSQVIISGTISSPLYGTVCEVGTGVTGEGASGADLTNPIENAMTSWRGRAISALIGGGMLPYTGIASAEEMQSAEGRNEMAEAGFNVVSIQPTAPASADKPEKNTIMVEQAHIDRTKAIVRVNDKQLADGLKRYCEANGIPYDDEPTNDFLLKQPLVFLNELMRFIKENPSG